MTPAQNRVAVQSLSELSLVCALLFRAIDDAGEAGVAVMRRFTDVAPDSLADFGARARKALEICETALESLKSGLGSGLWPERELSPLWLEHAAVEAAVERILDEITFGPELPESQRASGGVE